MCLFKNDYVYDHTMLKARHLVRSVKLSNVGPAPLHVRSFGNLMCLFKNDYVYDHTMLKARHLVRSVKLSNVGPDKVKVAEYFGPEFLLCPCYFWNVCLQMGEMGRECSVRWRSEWGI
ncbi:unnamed protein product [Cercopithifilaria johnstoni]|uniref:Uncharacterized protein n=1 Tax=Cercopithifilaria johnstoni TaxID=2874296 RepID=A0A8J2PYU8_9BILA|nr:unnamed protein product [Cercopithifilaria johnstoni]